MRVSVVIPYRDTGRAPQRESHLLWILNRLRTYHPDWEVVIAPDGRSQGEPWSAATARVRGVSQASGDVIALLDADTWSRTLAHAVHLVEAGKHRWVMTHALILRLSQEQTDYYKLNPGYIDPVFEWSNPSVLAKMEQAPFRQFSGGVPTVITRELFEACPQDVRFDGWGAEDNAWGYALETLHEKCWRLQGQAVHFWHEPEPGRKRHQEGDVRTGGYEFESHEALQKRYWFAMGKPEEMRRIVSEHTAQKLEQARHD